MIKGDLMLITRLELNLPDWINIEIENVDRRFESIIERMLFVIKIAHLNVIKGAGGPFGAAIFDYSTGELFSVGVNQVQNSNCSIAHAEMLAISLAQKKFNTFDLGAEGIPKCELVTSTAPCAMCLGAIPWSGVKRVVCGARDEDARRIGFDEGAKVANWIEELEKRGIEVATDVCRDQARSVLDFYHNKGGLIYNSSH
jgi:tRNA(Arg) A34 adenosine deaminase TadA